MLGAMESDPIAGSMDRSSHDICRSAPFLRTSGIIQGGRAESTGSGDASSYVSPDNSNMSSLPRALSTPLAQFVDSLPLPRRLIAADHEGRLVVRLRPGEHRFHRDLPPSRIWGYDGTVPGPTIETERGHPKYEVWRLINLTGDTHPIHL